ncbi:ExeM/NucH family extracellular endonuclease [Actibacterium lipolyticum]|uniref:Endonuclease/Exonuclease/phosphatase family protein n=1 Tax=Actibacterium lipolyticum TaxID=1524263 RepID=A0A238KRP6_9RHOB|nr:ExeM/NucH family extracellular endonuclease [Actibacterium lipolyticum]SMX44716.1 Endonuclease/Exonuclease/phosphatase family protein [Actibacterium lipolyticum]
MSIIFREDFETDGNGTRYVTSVPEFTDGSGDFFTRTDGTNIGSFYSVTGQSGASYFAVMDTDGEPPFATTVTVSINDIDISGYTDIQISGLFAEDDDGTNQDWDADSLVYIEAQIDGGGYFKVLQFASGGITNSEPGLDTDFDGIADGPMLTDSFSQFIADIAATGATLDLRITVENLTAGDEDIAFDDITVTGTAAPVAVTVLDETFDDAAGFTTSAGFFSDGGFDYFGITDGAGGGDFGGDAAPSGLQPYVGTTGSYLAGMDLDGEGASVPITVTWEDLDISGLTDLAFTGDFAEFFDSPGDIDEGDFILLEASIDGGPTQTVLSFVGADFSSTSGPFNGVFREDTNGDGIGDGATLTDAMANFAAEIEGTGSTLDLTLTVSVDSGDEDFAVDNFKIVGTSGGTVQPAVIARTDDGLNVNEEGETTDTFTLELNTAPTAPVTITVAAPDGQTLLSADGVRFAATAEVVITDTTPVTLTVKAVDDAVDEASPHFGDLTFTVTSADADYDGIAVGDLNVAVEDNDFSITLISEIQGSGDASAMDGQEVTIEGVVVGTIVGSSGISGYFIQEEDADADGDAATSEGIFVYAPGATVAVGDQVRVTGEVDEYQDLTEITNVSATQVLATGVTLPTATVINIGMSADFEAYEGMRVELVSASEDPLTVVTNFNLDRFGQVNVAEGNLTQPTQIYDPNTQQAEIAELIEANAAAQLIIDDGNTTQNPDIYTLIDSGDGTPLEVGDPITEDGPTLRLGAEVTSITGVMDERFGDYRVQVASPLETVEGTNEGARPDTAPDVGGELKVASFNVLNYFTTLDDGSLTGPNGDLDPRGASTIEDFERQEAKIVAALVELDADIIGLQELENNGFGPDSAIATLVDALNEELGAEVYAFVDPGVDYVGTDAITTGIIYKVDAVSVVGSDILVFEEESAAETYALVEEIQALTGTSPVGDFDRNRPTVAATFVDADGSEVTIAVNHFKSKGDSGLEDLLEDAVAAGIDQALIDALASDPNYDSGDGQGFWNGVRDDAASELTAWLDSNPTGASDPSSIVILGDLNAYAKEDPVQTIVGEGYTDLAAEYLGEGAYSFVFDGQRGTLDYGLASGDLSDNITGVAEWHINADEPDLLNYNSSFSDPSFYNDDFYAASDHDPMVIGLTLDDPTTTVRLDFNLDYEFAHAELIYTVDGVETATLGVRNYSKEHDFTESGIFITADDGLAKPKEFLNLWRDGLGVTSFPGDSPRVDGEAYLLDEEETITFKLDDAGGLGDALEVEFEFNTVRGEGDITLEFYSDGVMVEEAVLEIVDNAVSHDLAGNTSFDEVKIGVTGTLDIDIGAIELERLDSDEFLLV